jgi:hypothetical protein
MNNNYFSQNHNSIALISLILLLPAIMLVGFGLLKSLLGLQLANPISSQMGVFENPIFIMGGIFLSIILNFLTTFQFKFKSVENSFNTKITIKKYYSNLGILFLGGFLITIIILYLFVENFQFIPH